MDENRRVPSEDVARLLDGVDVVRRRRRRECARLLDDVDDIRRGRRRECVGLLRELTPHLRAARTVELELDRHFARRFNVFRYLRDDELGLSRVIADLLDPDAEHGQGTAFLDAMLELLEVAPEAVGSGRSGGAASGGRRGAAAWKVRLARPGSTGAERIRVARERRTTRGRFIDVTVDIPTRDAAFCLAFENKPYAEDQPGQCRDYLRFLEEQYGERFLLVYLPPRYRMPDESSLPPADRERWKNHFRVLPYVGDDAPGDGDPADEDGVAIGRAGSDEDGVAIGRAGSGEDDAPAVDAAKDHKAAAAMEDAAVGDGASLADWFGTCCKLSDAERLRWFLREAQLFCREHLRGYRNMTDTEARYVREYLDENPKHLHAAFAVARAWPAVKHDVCRRFLEHLKVRVEEGVWGEMPEAREKLQVNCRYEGDKRWSNSLELGRMIMIQSAGPGPNGWIWGIRNPRPKTLRQELLAALERRGLSLQLEDDGWPQYEYLPRHGHWDHLVPELDQEITEGRGKITDYYVSGLLGIAAKAIPAFDEVELENGSPSDPEDS